LSGSWINTNVSDSYELILNHACNIYYFDNNKFLPLYLSFLDENHLKATFRIEQKIFTFLVNHSNPDSIFIYRDKNHYRIYFENGVLKLQYGRYLITFKKVSNNYSKNVFGEYVKENIFKKNKSYVITFFKESDKYKKLLVNRNNFLPTMVQMFKCNAVDLVDLGTFGFENACLPEVAIYQEGNARQDGPRRLGIVIGTDSIILVDSRRTNILTLKPN
jgi:hypothetical protein